MSLFIKKVFMVYLYILLYTSSIIIFQRNTLFLSVGFFSAALIIILYFFYNNTNKFNLKLLAKIIIFTLFLLTFFVIERFFMVIFLFGMDGVGFLQRSGIVDYFHKFTQKEDIYYMLLSTLYYPIYIFLFIIPFVNHLDKSTKKTTKEKK